MKHIPYIWWLIQDPEEAIRNLISDVAKMDLSKRTENGLVSKLENAIQSMDKREYVVSVDQLNSFISQVEASLGKKLTEKQADDLFAAAELIINSIYA
jgi:hypothetical protein